MWGGCGDVGSGRGCAWFSYSGYAMLLLLVVILLSVCVCTIVEVM